MPGRDMSTSRSMEGLKGMGFRFTQRCVSHSECTVIPFRN